MKRITGKGVAKKIAIVYALVVVLSFMFVGIVILPIYSVGTDTTKSKAEAQATLDRSQMLANVFLAVVIGAAVGVALYKLWKYTKRQK